FGDVELFGRGRVVQGRNLLIAHPLVQLVDRPVRPVHLVQLLADFGRRDQEQPDLPRGRECQRLFGVEIEGVGRPQLEEGIGEAERQDAVASRQLFRHAVPRRDIDRKSTRLNSSHQIISYAVFCLKKKKKLQQNSKSSQ